MILRRANAFDSGQIHKLETSSIECAWTLEQIKEAILDEYYVFFVAEEQGKIISYGGARLVIDEAEICNIATDVEFRRRGLGNKVLFELEKHCFDKGIKGMFLEVNSKNDAAIQLYKKAGFKPLNIRKNYYHSGDAVIMTKDLKKLRKQQ